MVYGHSLKNLWYLSPDVTFLNHGSFGLTPKSVLEYSHALEKKIDSQPLDFFLEEYFPLINKAAAELASFIGAEQESLVFVENACTAANTVINYLSSVLAPQSEILYINHIYLAVNNALKHLGKHSNLVIKELPIAFPIESDEQIIELVRQAINSNTKALFLDHVSSATALIFPIEGIVKLCNENGIFSVIDGAHAPGMLDLNISDIKPDFYFGNAHKWLFAPKGCAFLYVAQKFRDEIHPLVISNFYENGYNAEFAWIGTRQPSSWLSIVEALKFYKTNGDRNIRDYNRNLCLRARNLICDELHIDKPSPDAMIGSIASLPFPYQCILDSNEVYHLRKYFRENFKIEIMFSYFDNKMYFRFSSNIYNEITDYERLVAAFTKYGESK